MIEDFKNGGIALRKGDSEFEREGGREEYETIDDDLGIEDCTPMAESQIMRTFSKKKLGRLDETSFQQLSQLDYAPNPITLISPQSKVE